jgi:hypothetical protein
MPVKIKRGQLKNGKVLAKVPRRFDASQIARQKAGKGKTRVVRRVV